MRGVASPPSLWRGAAPPPRRLSGRNSAEGSKSLPGIPSTLPASPEHLLTPPRPCWPIEPPHAHGRPALPAGPSRPVGEPSRPSSGPRPSSTVPDTIPPLTSGTLIYFPALPLPPLPFHTRAAVPRRILAGYFFCKSFPPAHTIRHPTPRQARTTTPGRRKHTQTNGHAHPPIIIWTSKRCPSGQRPLAGSRDDCASTELPVGFSVSSRGGSAPSLAGAAAPAPPLLLILGAPTIHFLYCPPLTNALMATPLLAKRSL